MPYVCSRDGHLLEEVSGDYCPEHGSLIWTNCPNCNADWGVIPGEGLFSEQGARFCSTCAYPGSWVSRPELIIWLQDRLNEQHLDRAKVLELQEVLGKLARMDPDDTRALSGWEKLKKAAPGVWDIGKQVLASVIGETLKRNLGLS